MKRLLAATSLFALVAGGAAFAQTSTGPTSPGQMPNDQYHGNSNQMRGVTGATPGNQAMPSGSGSMSNGGASSGTDAMSNRGGASSGGMTSSNGTGQNVSQDEVKQAQTELKQHGLYKGQVDGVLGPQTRNAIAQYQKQNGLRETAQLDQATMQHLMQGGRSGTSSGSSGAGTSNGSSTGGSAGSMGGGAGSMGNRPGTTGGSSSGATGGTPSTR